MTDPVPEPTHPSAPAEGGGAADSERASLPETLLTAPPSGTPRPGAPAPWPTLPGYEVLQKLGQGGMGVVYKARQARPSRLVAVKMLRYQDHASPSEVQVFHDEPEKVVQIQHPNIVHIYEVGEHEGRPYFSMEYVDGGSLAQKLAGSPQPAGPAAGLVETLARAMHVAHQKGIVHRDLKPANVLLQSPGSQAGDFGTPKITDFGLAKELGPDVSQTQSLAVRGTPSYMAPEQAAGDSGRIGPAADVYALGAVLYELLTGRPPFRGPTVLDTLEQVRVQEPVPPRRLQPKVPRDLETICLKCLNKEPRQRYAGAHDLAEDLRRFRQGEAIAARPLGLAGRLLRWARRRPREAALAFVSVIAAAALVWIVIDARLKARERAYNEHLQAQHDQALAALDGVCQLVVDGELRNQAGLRPLLKKLLDYYQELVRRQEDSPWARRDRLAETYVRLATLAGTVGNKAMALESLTRARDLYARLGEAEPRNADLRDRLAETRINRGVLLRALGEWDEAEAEYQAAAEELGRLVREHADRLDFQLHRAEAFHNLGILCNSRNRNDQALEAYRRGLALRADLVDRSDEPLYRRDLARSHGYLGDVYREQGRYDDARAEYEKAHAIRERLWQANETDREARFQLARDYWNFGDLDGEQNHLEAALAAYEKARAIQEKLVGEHRAVTDYQADLGWVCARLGAVLVRLGRPEQARPVLERARELFQVLVQDNPDDLSFRAGLGWSLAYLGRTQEVPDPGGYLLEAQKVLEKVTRKRHDADDLYNLAFVYALRGAADDALKTLRRAQECGFRNAAQLEEFRRLVRE